MSDQGFVFGENDVVEIDNYTQPADNMGQVTLDVSYTYRVNNIVDWAKNDEIKNTFREIAQAFDSQNHPISAQTSMIKTAKGWMNANQPL